jgi:hypothetical protein
MQTDSASKLTNAESRPPRRLVPSTRRRGYGSLRNGLSWHCQPMAAGSKAASVCPEAGEQIRRSSVLSDGGLHWPADARMRNLPCVRSATNSTKRLSSTEGYPNQTPISQQLIGSKNSLGIFTSKRSLCMPAQRNQKSKDASVGGRFHFVALRPFCLELATWN